MNVLDLFSGIGGFSLGLERAGYTTVAFCEIDPFCQKVLRKHWPDVPIYNDVKDLHQHVQDLEHIDLITAGFPCTDISYLNDIHGEGHGIQGERSGLVWDAIRLVELLRPKWIIFENVEAFADRGLPDVIHELSRLRYDCEWHLIPATAVGAEHRRNRLWLIANDQGKRMERIWPEGFKVPSGHERKVLPLRDSDGQWKVEPDILRKAHGLSRGMDRHKRIKAIGNSLLPQIPEIIGISICQIEKNPQLDNKKGVL